MITRTASFIFRLTCILVFPFTAAYALLFGRIHYASFSAAHHDNWLGFSGAVKSLWRSVVTGEI